MTWLSFWWGMEIKCNKLYKIHSNLCFSYYLHHKNTYNYIQYNAVWQAHVFLCRTGSFDREQRHKNYHFVSFLSYIVLNVCLIPQHHPACRPACMPPAFIPDMLFGIRGYIVQFTLCCLFLFFFPSLSKRLVEHLPNRVLRCECLLKCVYVGVL